MEVFIGRQPIFNEKDDVLGYELFYRKDYENAFDLSITGNVATSIVLMNSYYTFGIERLSEGKKVYINFDKNLIESEIPTVLNKDIVVVEIPSDEVVSKHFVEKIKKLKEAGFTIALDNYIEGSHGDKLMVYCDMIKVDILSNSKETILRIVNKWKHTNKTLVAEKVESQVLFDWAKSIGFDLFQGYYFCKPKIIKGKSLLTSNMSYLRIMEEIIKSEPDYTTIASIIESDVVLTYRILKLVNANFVSYNKISSVKQALVTIGLTDFEKWVSLAMVQDLSKNKPPEVLKLAMLRGKFLELIIKQTLPNYTGSEGMLIGLLSVLDALTNQTMIDVLNDLPLTTQIKNTLLLEESPYTFYYQIILHIEKGNYGVAFSLLTSADIYVENLMEIYYASIDWASEMYSLINED